MLGCGLNRPLHGRFGATTEEDRWMSKSLALLAVVGAVAFAMPAVASTDHAAISPGCPKVQPRLHALGLRLKQLDDHLAKMDEVLSAQNEARRAAVAEAVAAVEAAVRQPGVSQQDIDEAIARAVTQAEIKTDAGIGEAQAAAAAIESMQPQLQALEDRIDAMSVDGDQDADTETSVTD